MGKRINGYWDDWLNVEKELQHIIDKLAHFPTQDELHELGCSDLCIAIARKHSGLLAARKRMGYPDPKYKRSGYWEEWENFKKEITPLVEKLGRLPQADEMIQYGLTHGAVHAVYIHHGGASEVRRRLGLAEINRKPSGYWKNLTNVKSEIEKIRKEKNLIRIPSTDQLQKWGFKGLSSAIYDYHGGIRKLRRDISEDPKTEDKPVYWTDIKNAKQKAEELMKDYNLDRLPNYERMLKFGYGDLAQAIMKRYGGFIRFRKLIGQEQVQRPSKYWKDLEKTIEATVEIMKERGWETLPSIEVLNENHLGGLTSAISKYHGGFRVFRDKIMEYLGKQSSRNMVESLLEGYIHG